MTARRGRGARRATGWLLAALPAVVVAVLPLVYLFLRATDQGWDVFFAIAVRSRTAELTANTLTLLVAVAASALALGTAAAWAVTRTALPLRRVWTVLLVMPLAVPSYVSGFAWLSMDVVGFAGAWLALTTTNMPLVLLPVAAALRSADPALEELSRSLGHGPWETFRRVTLPRVWPAALAGGLLVALYVLHDFGAVSLLRYETFTLGIQTSYSGSFDRTPAAVIGVVLVVLAVLLALAEARMRGTSTARLGPGVARQAEPVRLRAARWPVLLGLAGIVVVSLGVPLGALTRWLGIGRAELDPAALVSTTATTVQFAALGALATVALAVPVGFLAARHSSRPVRAVELAAYAGHALPGITVALALVFFGVRFAQPWYQRTPLLVLGYAALFLPIAISAVRTAVAAAPPAVEDVARSLGRGRARVFGTVTLPLAAPGIAAGAALVFLTCAKELPATLLLRPTGADTLATALWTKTGVSAFAEAAPYAALLVVVSAVPAVLLEMSVFRSGKAAVLESATRGAQT
ncbi:ABC transporter permease [Actinokineospora iranica]|uniref:Iron(III) transport system permease protein n=1 Tax=Actinokineospora iranica TaxID=1271860 RepID=A0A1G6K5Z0_9PSEU|nr:iron ABC transporter permease [Actinokineospora iranica]SDC26374.1 iron(III) transport system permease protein [Actinokineospora iranica]